MNTLIAAAVAVTLTVTAGCSAAPTSERSSSEPSSSGDPSVGQAQATELEGVWEKIVTEAQARQRGVPRAEYAEHLGADGRLPFVLTLEGTRFAVSVVNDQGVTEIGDVGTLEHDARRLVMTSESEGCPGCVGTLRWRLDGTDLELTDMTGPDVVDIDRLFLEGTWERAS